MQSSQTDDVSVLQASVFLKTVFVEPALCLAHLATLRTDVLPADRTLASTQTNFVSATTATT